MQPEHYRQFTQDLLNNLAQREDVLGLAAVGSMAGRDYQPDEWSDHDFFVIVRAGAQDRYRTHYDWLPDSEHIVWAFAETAHGVKVIYQSAHLVEYAVFDLDELYLARVNRCRVLLDRADVQARLHKIAQTTQDDAAGADDAFHAGQFLSNVLVGIGRYRRGERLSAHRFIKNNAVYHLAVLLNRHAPTEQRQLADNLDPTRRFERIHPALEREMADLLLREIPAAALGLLALYERELGQETGGPPTALFALVQRQCQAA